jgi:hypothetical protein
MPFLLSNPTAAWLLPAIALPILFHLFFRLRRQVQDFPSLMFFLRIDPRLSAKRKIHEWLILFLRCLFLALLIAALMRPLLGLRGSSEKVARLVLIDNSGSMAGLTTGGVSKMTLAERAAEKFITSSRKGDSVAVQLTVPDPTVTLPRGFDASPATLRDPISKLAPSDAAASIPRAIRSALATLETAKAPQRELHILTDLQERNWSRGELGPEATNCRIVIHRLESPPLTAGSVSIETSGLPTRSIPAERITPIRVMLQNTGPVAAHVTLNSTDDSGKNSSRDFDVPPNATTPAVLTFSFPHPGFHWAQIWVEGNTAATATRAELGFWCTDVQKVLFVGNKDDFGAMPYAVSPGGSSDLSGIDTSFVPADQLASNLESKPLGVVLTWPTFPQDSPLSSTLQDYVRQGGTLFLLPPADAGLSVSRPPPAWLGVNPGTLATVKEAEPLVLLQPGDSLWENLRDTDGQPRIGLLRALQYQPLTAGSDWQTMISSANGAPLLARRSLDQGRIFASGLGFTPKWSSLPLRGGFVVLMQNAIFGDRSEKIPVQNIRAGDEFHFDFPNETVSVKSLAGSALDWHGKASDFEGLPHAGVYEISQRDHISWVATSGNTDEADPRFLPDGPIALLHNTPNEVVSLLNEDDISNATLSKTAGTSLYRWLLLAALLVLLAETWLANKRSSDLGKKLFSSLIPSPPAGKALPKKSEALVQK